MGWFDGFRDSGHNTYYGQHRNPVLADVTHLIVILICIMFSAALVLVIIGTRGRERWTTFLRVAFTLHTGVAILITLFGQDWQVAFIQSHCSYSTLFQDEIMAYVHVRVGLKSVNITLEGDVTSYDGISHVDYNERFNFNQISDMELGVAAAKLRGLPQPVLYVAEYFGVDTGGLTWNRTVRMAGHFVFILEWASLAAWIVSNIVVNFVVFHGAAIMILVGCMMSGACVLYNSLQPATPFTIPFEDAYIHFQYGWCFWVCAVSGGVTLITGVIILVLYKLFPQRVQLIFLLDTSHLVDDHDEEVYAHPLEIEQMGSRRKTRFVDERPPAYVNKAFTDDFSLRMRTKDVPTDAAAADPPARSPRYNRRVSTISIGSSSGPDAEPTVLINGKPVTVPLPVESDPIPEVASIISSASSTASLSSAAASAEVASPSSVAVDMSAVTPGAEVEARQAADDAAATTLCHEKATAL